jgi:NADPH2:quinone reductase
MKAALVRAFGPVETLEIVELPDPHPGPDEVVIDVAAAELNFADILVIEGNYQFKPPLPFSPGKAAAGTIAALGPGVSEFSIGDRVAVHVEYGAFAQKLLVKTSQCFALPDATSFEDAAALGLAYQTSWFALKDRGIGMAAVQLAKAFGAAMVIAGTRNADAHVRDKNGADYVLETSSETDKDQLRAEVTRITDGRGVDIVIDPVGGAIGEAALRTLAWRGRFIVVGFAAGQMPTFKAGYILVKNITVSGLQWSDYRDRDPRTVAEAQKEIFALRERGHLRPHVAEVVSFDDIPTALARLRQGAGRGRYLLRT